VNRPRFVASSVTGYPITQKWEAGKERTIWSVLDSAFSFRRVDNLTRRHRYGERGERNARALAAKLNADQALRVKRARLARRAELARAAYHAKKNGHRA
jgi:hypothetical protein